MKIWEQYAPELVTDLYELTMAASYFREGMSGEATFSLFIRDYPPDRAYFVSAGLQHLIEILSDFRFSRESLDYLRSLGKFSPQFLDFLRGLRFRGSVRGIAEGRIFFSQEPIVEVTASIIEAQVIETLVLNVVQLETLLATKAARVVQAASGKGLIDFGMRRTHGVDAAVKAARASYIAGFAGTSNLLAGKIYGIPVFGTMAHSYVTSFQREMDSFLAFARAFPGNTVLLIDTYDTVAGAVKAAEVAGILAGEGKKLVGVRLDSGDMNELSQKVRQVLDRAGFPDVSVMASGNLDEFKVDALVRAGAEIDFYAVGTRMGVSSDAPYLDIAYKLVEYDGRPVLKLSSGKKTWIGRKQVYRHRGADGQMSHDSVCLLDAGNPGGEPLLELVMRNGKPVCEPEPLDTIRKRFAQERENLPDKYRLIRAPAQYPVEVCEALRELDAAAVRKVRCAEVETVRNRLD